VGEIVGRTPGACRQLASSARHRIDASHAVAEPTAEHADIVRNFKRAWEATDIAALIELLDPDATATGDGGGIVTAVLHPIVGAEEIAHFYVDRADALADLTIVERTVNGQPGLIVQHDGVTAMVMAFDITHHRIKHIWAVLNPEKLRPWRTN
jgi:RNA polymerase sigma-70 factor (ECF subfamily)